MPDSGPDLATVEEIYPLAPVQFGMLYHLIGGEARPGTYIGQHIVAIDGALDAAAFRGSWEAVIGAHDALRAGFVWEGLDQPLQPIFRSATLPWRQTDGPAAPGADEQALIDRFSAAELVEGFDLRQPPLMRLHLLKLSDQRHILIWTCHHLISDGWSHAILLEEVFSRYQARVCGIPEDPPPSAHYRDYLEWVLSRDADASARFWRGYLAGLEAPTPLQLPRDGAAGPNGRDRVSVPLEPAFWAQVTDRARALRLTPSTLAMAAWAWVLRVYAGQTEVVFGVTSSVRPSAIPGIERTAGVFINTQPVRVQIAADAAPEAVLQRLHQDMIARRPHEHTGLADIQAASPLGPGQPLFETLFAYEGFAEPSPPEGLEVSTLSARDASEFPFTLLVRPGQDGVLEAVFSPEIYEAGAAERLLGHVKSVLAQLADGDLAAMGALRLGAAVEARQIEAFSEAPQDIGAFESLVQIIDRHAHQTPDAPAVAFGAARLSYAELAQRSDLVAGALSEMNIGAGDVVAVALDRGPDAIIAALGVMKAGAAYLPMDPGYPATRLTTVLQAARPAGVILGPAGIQGLGLPDGARPLAMADLSGQGTARPSVTIGPGDPAYVVYTSGSTGVPKGVVATHGNLWASTLARPAYYGERPSAFLILSSLAFDSSLAGLYWALSVGATAVLSEPRLEQSPEALARTLAASGVTHMLCLPGLWNALLGAVPHAAFGTLRTVILAGEALTGAVVAAHRAALPNVRLVNEYGPTEATVWCAAFDATKHTGQAVPIGWPVPNYRLEIRDTDGNPCPLQVPGEIRVGGPGVTLGYLHRPDLTAAAFDETSGGRTYRTGDIGRWLPSGAIAYLGRRDDQVKIRGHRVELAEVEGAVLALGGVAEAAVVAVGTAPRQSLAALVVTANGAVPTRRTLEARLPEAMIPAHIVAVPSLPRLPNGKVDKTAAARLLDRAPKAAAREPEAPSPMAARLAVIWAELLGRDSVGMHDNFFDLGGDSLLSIRVAARAKAAGLDLVAHDLFDFPTVAELAEFLDPDASLALAGIADDSVAIGNAAGRSPPFFMIHGRKRMFLSLAQALGPRHPVGILFGHWEEADLDPRQSVERLTNGAMTHLRAFQSNGPYRLGGYSIGGVIAAELAGRLRRAGEEVELLFLLDPPTTARMDALGADAARAEVTDDQLATTLGQKLRKHWGLIRKRPLAEVPGYLGDRIRSSAQYYITDPAKVTVAAAQRRARGKIPKIRRHHYVTNVYNAAFRRYVPRPYDGQALIVATRSNVAAGNLPQWWRAAFPEAEVHLLDKSHIDLQLDPDTIEEWCALLQAALGRRGA